jgi:hypothetical protein
VALAAHHDAVSQQRLGAAVAEAARRRVVEVDARIRSARTGRVAGNRGGA